MNRRSSILRSRHNKPKHVELYVDLDVAGRKSTVERNEEEPDNAKRPKLSGIYRRKMQRSLGQELQEEQIIPDLCGRGDPDMFEEISRRDHSINAKAGGGKKKVDHSNIDQHNREKIIDYELLSVIADAQHHSLQSKPFRRTLAPSFRKSKSFYNGMSKFLGFPRSSP